MNEQEIRGEIRNLVKKFFDLKKDPFVPGKTKVKVAGNVFDHNETSAAVNSLLDGWVGLGKLGRLFETEFARYVGSKDAAFVNSGSSANLLAIASLSSNQFDQRLKTGDEIITQAMTFPTTINPSIIYGLKPVIVDSNLGSYTVNTDEIRKSVSDRTKAIMIHHPLGNPNEMDEIMEIANEKDLFVVEDCCDALGSQYSGKMVGTFGIFGTFSFYAAHHMSTGEGGAIVSDDEKILSIVRSIRDWGRVAWCEICKKPLDTTYDCPHRFVRISEKLPEDYDRRYTYMNTGFNLKPIELQGGIGLEQLKKFPSFLKSRKKNFNSLLNEFQKFEEFFILPESHKKSEPSWFAFPLTVRDRSPFKRKDIVDWFEKNGIETRMLFAGNIVNHPAYSNVNFRLVGDLKNTNLMMRNSFFIGVYPGIDEARLNFVIEKTNEFMRRF